MIIIENKNLFIFFYIFHQHIPVNDLQGTDKSVPRTINFLGTDKSVPYKIIIVLLSKIFA